MIKSIQRKTRIKALLWFLICTGLAVLVLAVFVPEIPGFFQVKGYLFENTTATLREDVWYDGQNDILLDYFCSDDKGYYYVTTVDTPDGGYTYMGFFVPRQNESQAQAIADSTYDYWSGKTAVRPDNYIEGIGKLHKMTGDEYSYFYQYFEGSELENDLYPYTFTLYTKEGLLESGSVIWLALTAVLLAVALYWLLSLLTGSVFKNMKRDMSDYGVPNEVLAQDLALGEKVSSLFIGKKYLVSVAKTKPLLMKMDDLLWIYPSQTTTHRRIYGIIPAGSSTTYSVCITDRKKRQTEASMRNTAQSDRVVNLLASLAPHAIAGYSDELKALRDRNFSELVRIVDERKTEMSYEAARQPYGEAEQENTIL